MIAVPDPGSLRHKTFTHLPFRIGPSEVHALPLGVTAESSVHNFWGYFSFFWVTYCSHCNRKFFFSTKGLFSQEDGKEIHNEACFKQTCDQSLSSCGRTKFAEVFASLVSKLGEHRTEVFQHQKQSYVKPDGSQV